MNRRQFLADSSATLTAAVLTRCSAAGSVEKAMSLLGAGESAMVATLEEDLPIAQYFVSAFADLTGAKLEIITGDLPKSRRPVVIIGDVRTSRLVRRLAGETRVAKLTAQGILLATLADGGRPILLLAGGSREATPGAIGELLNFRIDAGPNHAAVPAIDLLENPVLPYRLFWTWDHSTNWSRGVAGEHEHGVQTSYMKVGQNFVKDYARMADFMGEHKLNGVIIWGFLRSSHGGAEAGKESVNYAFDHGVRILPGIGTSHYGGFYYEGAHRFNTRSWLAQNPSELRFLTRDGVRKPDTLCPSKPENQQWLRDGAEWMFSEFPKLGGANLENGDFFACQTDDCIRNRQNPRNDPNYYWDMMVTQLPIIEAARKINPSAWMTYATYTGFNPQEIWQLTDKSLVHSAVPKFISQLPEESICQWTYTDMVRGWGQLPEAEVRKKWPAGLRPPTKHSIGLLHQGSQWSASELWWTKSPRGPSTQERYVDISELIRYTCLRCAEEGLEGLEIQGEVSSDSPANELNYLALSDFGWRPHLSMDDFVSTRLVRLYGTHEETRLFLRMVRDSEPSAAALLKDINLAEEVSHNRQFNTRQRRRWANLRAELARRLSLLP